MNLSKSDIIDNLLSDLFNDKRENSLSLVVGDFNKSAKKIITKHLDNIKDETEIPET